MKINLYHFKPIRAYNQYNLLLLFLWSSKLSLVSKAFNPFICQFLVVESNALFIFDLIPLSIFDRSKSYNLLGGIFYSSVLIWFYNLVNYLGLNI